MVKISERGPADRLETVDVRERSDRGTGPTSPIIEREERITHDVAAERGLFLTQVSQFIWLLLGIVNGLIGLRVLLKLMAANPNNSFAKFVYDFTVPFLGPFTNLTNNPTSNGSVLETSSLIAMLAYVLGVWALVKLLWVLFGRPSAQRVSIVRRDRR